jgi:competence protein ComEC
MVLQNPSILAFDPSFQLSFLASLGLIFMSPLIERHTSLFYRWKVAREVFVSTLATQCLVLPLLLYQTGMFSIVSLPANMLVLPIIPLTMLTGFLAGLTSFVFPPLAPVVALPAHMLLSYILFIADTLSRVPFAALSVPISSSSVVVLYVLLGAFIWSEARAIKKGEALSQAPHQPQVRAVDDKKETLPSQPRP